MARDSQRLLRPLRAALLHWLAVVGWEGWNARTVMSSTLACRMESLFASSSLRISCKARVLSVESMSWEASNAALAALATLSVSALVDILDPNARDNNRRISLHLVSSSYLELLLKLEVARILLSHVADVAGRRGRNGPSPSCISERTS
jgi:hypothetical protein